MEKGRVEYDEGLLTLVSVRHRNDVRMLPGLRLGRDFPMPPLVLAPKWDASAVFNTKERLRLRHNAHPKIESPTHTKIYRIRGRQLSHLNTPLLRLPQVLSPHLL